MTADAQRIFGATTVEARTPLPGDGLVADPLLQITHAITIDAAPERIWSWLTQIGQGRAGFYSDSRLWDAAVSFYYRLLSREAGRNPVSYQHQEPEHGLPIPRPLKAGDAIADGPPGTAYYSVREVEPNRTLVLFTDTHLPYLLPSNLRSHVSGILSDAFVLLPMENGQTRFLRRMRLRCEPPVFRALALPVVLLWGEAITARRFLRGLKRRAERPSVHDTTVVGTRHA